MTTKKKSSKEPASEEFQRFEELARALVKTPKPNGKAKPAKAGPPFPQPHPAPWV
jgi:hypothetical protein